MTMTDYDYDYDRLRLRQTKTKTAAHGKAIPVTGRSAAAASGRASRVQQALALTSALSMMVFGPFQLASNFDVFVKLNLFLPTSNFLQFHTCRLFPTLLSKK